MMHKKVYEKTNTLLWHFRNLHSLDPAYVSNFIFYPTWSGTLNACHINFL